MYDCSDKSETMMTVYLSGTKARVEAKIYPLKGGIADIPKGKELEAIIFDFQANKEIHVVDRKKLKSEQDFIELAQEKKMKLGDGDITVEMVGTEKVNSFNCEHFAVRIKGKKLDLWITKELGVSSLYVAGPLTYYPNGSQILAKIKAAGGEGVVVRAHADDLTTNLTTHSSRPVPASTFEVPADYKKIN